MIGENVPLTNKVSPLLRVKNTVESSVTNAVADRAPAAKQNLQAKAQATAENTRAAGRATVASTRWFLGISRDGVIAARRQISNQIATPTTRTGARQVATLLLGSSLIGLGVSLFVQADLGVPASDVLLTALRDRLGLSLGQAGWLFTGLLFVVASLLGQRPRPSALVYVAANGIAVDTFIHLIRSPDALMVRIGFVVLGTLAIATAISLVLHSGLSGGAFELLMRAGEQRNLNPFHVRTGVEVSVVTAGIALGGDIGPATAVFVAAMAPSLRALQLALSDHRNGRHLRLLSEQAHR